MTEEILKCYRLLEIEPGATQDAARSAYREMVKVWHPDRFPNDPALQAKANEKLKQFNLAFDLIKKTWDETNESVRSSAPPESLRFDPVIVDKFRYYDGFVDELNLTTDFDALHNWPSSVSAAPTVEFIKLIDQVLGVRRNFSISLVPNLNEHGASISARLELRARELVLSAESCSIKGILFFLFLLYFRDGVFSTRTKDQTFVTMLEVLGWNGKVDTSNSLYLQAEWEVCAHTAEELMHRLLNSRGSNGSIRQSHDDFMGRLRLKWGRPNLDDIKRFMASRYLNDPSYQEMHSK